ncbi:hypothetical protein K4C27_004716 [Escherichia coli]|uniref:hypothetical protein n=1 Tax=Escherichia coli TaxID=562 RepID=UPI0015D69E6C|nr:hypothetical protein [Escherichia coli]EHY3138016.1 hypothetical protein [Escherichia coli]MCI5377283.1 hypothetical protein [Escherichia coli]
MNGCTDNMPKKQSSSQGSFFFLVLLAVWTGVFFMPKMFFLVIPGGGICAFVFLFIICHRKDFIRKVVSAGVVSIALIVLFMMLPFMGKITTGLWLAYRIMKKIKRVRCLLSDALLSMILYTSLLIPVLLHSGDYIGFSNILVMTICGGIYSVASVECVMCICERSETLTDNLFFISVMLLSIPIITLLLVSDSLDGTVQQAFTPPWHEYSRIRYLPE